MNDTDIRIAVAGHANAGKTTLVRTLLKRKVGKVEDRVGVTLSAESYALRSEKRTLSFKARFGHIVDSPGLENAQEILKRERNRVPLQDLDMESLRQEFPLDFKALDAIREADATLYVATLENPPGSTHHSEIGLIKSRCPPVIGILNQYNVIARGRDVAAADNRIELWRECLQSHGVERVISFDAHWDSPSKIRDIYQAIQDLLPGEKAPIFQESLLVFSELFVAANYATFELISDLVINARSIHEREDSQDFPNGEKEARARLTEKIKTGIQGLIDKFVKDVAVLYAIAANPTTPAVRLQTSSVREAASKLKSTAAGVTIGASLGTLILGILALTVPAVTAVAATAIAAGAGAGGFLGGVGGALSRSNLKVEATLSSTDLYGLARLGLAIVYGASHQGFGKGGKVEEKGMTALMHFVEAHLEKVDSLQWEQVSKTEMINWCSASYQTLEGARQDYLLST